MRVKLLLEEQELLLRCDRESDAAICVIPAQGYGPWLTVFKRVATLPEVQMRLVQSGNDVVAYEFTFPKEWLRPPKPPRMRRGSRQST